ncbi:hypothetical protein [Stieleria marina]|uniref:hypothetical protein n=1 Tax=Stieleria marina TaxID=1930275 RepID=UPI003AF3DC91
MDALSFSVDWHPGHLTLRPAAAAGWLGAEPGVEAVGIDMIDWHFEHLIFLPLADSGTCSTDWQLEHLTRKFIETTSTTIDDKLPNAAHDRPLNILVERTLEVQSLMTTMNWS